MILLSKIPTKTTIKPPGSWPRRASAPGVPRRWDSARPGCPRGDSRARSPGPFGMSGGEFRVDSWLMVGSGGGFMVNGG